MSESLRRTIRVPGSLDGWAAPDRFPGPELVRAASPPELDAEDDKAAPPLILVADDDPLARHLTERLLTRAGYMVIAVSDGLRAMEHLTRKHGPRLALLDWSMPGLDGPEVCRQLRDLPDRPYIYVILLTSRESKVDMVNGFEAGSDDYVTKPCHAEELKARLRAGQRILKLQDKLLHDARHDPLTQLPNRACFISRLEKCFETARERREFRFGVLFLDLDGFKGVNDRLGHAAGDQLLKLVANRLRRGLRADDSLSRPAARHSQLPPSVNNFPARLGGDEFTVLLEGIRSEAEAIAVASRLEQDLAEPFIVNQQEIVISASIGVAVNCAECGRPEDLLIMADAAMYRAKALRDKRHAVA